MDRQQFLENLFLMFPMTFNEFNVSLWRAQYEQKLREDIDFQELFNTFMDEHKSVTVAPTPTFLRDFAKSRNLIPIKNNVVDYKPSNCAPPPKEWYEQYEKLKKKLSMRAM